MRVSPEHPKRANGAQTRPKKTRNHAETRGRAYGGCLSLSGGKAGIWEGSLPPGGVTGSGYQFARSLFVFRCSQRVELKTVLFCLSVVCVAVAISFVSVSSVVCVFAQRVSVKSVRVVKLRN